MRKFGALPPPGFEWQTGKTAATIRWVAFLETRQEKEHMFPFQDIIDALKSGVLVATQFPPGE